MEVIWYSIDIIFNHCTNYLLVFIQMEKLFKILGMAIANRFTSTSVETLLNGLKYTNPLVILKLFIEHFNVY